MKSCAGIGVLFACLVAISPLRAAETELKDKTQLIDLLKSNQSITVIDGRGPGTRARKPIPFSLIPGEMNVKFTGVAVVVADNDDKAIALARQLSLNGKRRIYALRGGYDTWVQAQSASQAEGAESSAASDNFIIPSNTCEQGDALQSYQE